MHPSPHFYPNACAVCNALSPNKELLRCEKCMMITYCNEKHQYEHWPQHKQICVAIQKIFRNREIPKGHSMRTWTKQQDTFMLYLVYKLRRPLTTYEREMFLFSVRCEYFCTKNICITHCRDCASINYCKTHTDYMTTHKPVCDTLKQTFYLDVFDNERIEFDYLGNIYRKSFGSMASFSRAYIIHNNMSNPTMSADLVATHSEYFTRPLTLLYAIKYLKKKVWGKKYFKRFRIGQRFFHNEKQGKDKKGWDIKNRETVVITENRAVECREEDEDASSIEEVAVTEEVADPREEDASSVEEVAVTEEEVADQREEDRVQDEVADARKGEQAQVGAAIICEGDSLKHEDSTGLGRQVQGKVRFARKRGKRRFKDESDDSHCDFTIHVMATDAEIITRETWEVLLHFVEKLDTLRVIMIGPELDRETGYIAMVQKVCASCQKQEKKLLFEYHSAFYKDYARSPLFRVPDVTVAFNSPFDNYTCGFLQDVELWYRSILEIRAIGRPFFLTTATSDFEEQYHHLYKVFGKQEIAPDFYTENPYASLRPRRRSDNKTFGHTNKKLFMYTTFAKRGM